MKNEIDIRSETADDQKSIYDLHLSAFGRRVEPELVGKIRSKENFIPELSLVAVNENKILGHLLFSIITIESEGKEIPVLALSVISVLPEYQKKGIGTKLIKRGLEKCRRLGHNVIIVIGHPSYYPRFGFVPASGYGLSVPFEAPDEAVMAAELAHGALNGISGTIQYPPEFAEDLP
ncbi:MAG: N-acetyltransferase [Deltaproteobacteria bacterium]|uniref:N-acetyltransferase n=1 Tax=Candidatus Zymogenus saltonus TaxID=2844893 RepID=A0A9D8PJM0_9DELT|nr:N-acetyltransferase [Candidatus Zymogenus saltonus]